MKIRSDQAVPKRNLSAIARRTFATFAAISGVAALLIAGLFAHHAAGRRPAGLRQLLQLPGRAA